MDTKSSVNKGMLSIESKNIFSILKKWLYTEQDIVFRELISNASDAIEKLSRLREEDPTISQTEGCIIVKLEPETNRLIIRDNGIGMSFQEVEKYINNIAFSGAEEFITQNGQSDNNTIIGHFGVGFYSSFMLSDHVAIETKSYRANTPSVHWDCLSDMSFDMKPCDKNEIGTDIILYLDQSNPYLKKPSLILDIIKKYFIFSKTAIYLDTPEHDHVLVNNMTPIWKKPKSKIDVAEMNEFYKEFFSDVMDPLFWIQIESVDIGLRGILFFRNTKQGTEDLDGTIKIYNRGVYVGENIKELVPKFVNLQSGIIECDHLPLVVSRSTIRDESQSGDDMIKLISESLTQEVTIALNDIFQNRRDEYEKHWQDIGPFVKYGVMQDKIFASVMTRKIIFKDIYDNYYTINEYMENNEQEKTVYYSSDKLDQAHYIEIFKKCGLNALLFDHVIDQPLMYRFETLHADYKFIRIDSNIESVFAGSLEDEDAPHVEILKSRFTEALGERLESSMKLRFTRLEHESISTLIIKDENSRRMADMMEIYGFLNPTDFAAKEKHSQSTLLININNRIVKFILETTEKVAADIVINQLFDLSLMSQQALNAEDVEQFISRSEDILTASLENLN